MSLTFSGSFKALVTMLTLVTLYSCVPAFMFLAFG